MKAVCLEEQECGGPELIRCFADDGVNGLSLYLHRDTAGRTMLIEMVDRKGNHVYLKPDDGPVLTAFARRLGL